MSNVSSVGGVSPLPRPEESQTVEHSKVTSQANDVDKLVKELRKEAGEAILPYVKPIAKEVLKPLVGKPLADILAGGIGEGAKVGVKPESIEAKSAQKKVVLENMIHGLNEVCEQNEIAIGQHLKKISNVSSEKMEQVEQVCENLKKICFEQVPAEQAFPYNLFQKAWETIGPLFGYEISKELTKEQYHAFCENLDKALNEQKQTIEEIKNTYTQQVEAEWKEKKEATQAPFKEKLAEASSIAPDLTQEMFKEVTRGSLNGLIEVLGNMAIMAKVAGPLPFLLGTVTFNVCKQTGDMVLKKTLDTQSATEKLDVSVKEGQIQMEEKQALAFMTNLVNSMGVANAVAIAALLIPGAGPLVNIIRGGIVATLAKQIATLNPTASSKDELKLKSGELVKELAQDITKENFELFALEFEQSLMGASEEKLLEVIKNSIPDERVAEALAQKLQESFPSYDLDTQEIQSKEVETAQGTEESESLSEEEKEMQNQVALFAFSTITLLLIKALIAPAPKKEAEKKPSEAEGETTVKKDEARIEAEKTPGETEEKTIKKDEAKIEAEKKLPETEAKAKPIRPPMPQEVIAATALIFLTEVAKEQKRIEAQAEKRVSELLEPGEKKALEPEKKKALTPELQNKIKFFKESATNIVNATKNTEILDKKTLESKFNDLSTLVKDSFDKDERKQIQKEIKTQFKQLETINSDLFGRNFRQQQSKLAEKFNEQFAELKSFTRPQQLSNRKAYPITKPSAPPSSVTKAPPIPKFKIK